MLRKMEDRKNSMEISLSKLWVMVHGVRELEVTTRLNNKKSKMSLNFQDLCFDCTHL